MNLEVKSNNRIFNWSALIGATSLLGMFATNVITVNVGIAHNAAASKHNRELINQNQQAIVSNQRVLNDSIIRLTNKMDHLMELIIKDVNLDREGR
jgi:hypothetical protein